MKKLLTVCIGLVLVMGVLATLRLAGAKDDGRPTRENLLVVDMKGKRVLIYTEVSEKNLHEANPHWGVVFKDGKFGEKAILVSFANPLNFHDAPSPDRRQAREQPDQGHYR